ncbi:MAG: alpha/beta hydrolase [Acutalibacteraceae bacterium]|nr:alpha/beta hydrolase [Acutalibacteraceae bacterium]
MLFPTVLKEKDYLSSVPQILIDLNAFQTCERIKSFDGTELYTERYIKEGNRANIVIIHGFTEFSEKYKEMIWYYINLGLNVFIYDQRGHGLSERPVDNINLIHVESFSDYIADLDFLIENQVKVYGENLPIYLFSHSMGGAVAALYKAEHPKEIAKSIMSSPMICPEMHGLPRKLVLWKAKQEGEKNGWSNKFPYTGEFNPDVNFEDTVDGSEARFNATFKLRLAQKEYQSSSATNKWMYEAVKAQDYILKCKDLNVIDTDTLILSAGNDRVVKNKMQVKFAKRLTNCRVKTFKGAKHNLFFASEDILENYYKTIFEFLS